MQIHVIYEDNHLLVVNKPPGTATMGVEADQPSMAKFAAAYLKEKYNKPGNVFVGVVNRLDSAVSGVLPLARTTKCASRLSEQIRNRNITKRYLAIVDGKVDAHGAGEVDGSERWYRLDQFVRKNEPQHRMEVCNARDKSAQEAALRYRLIQVHANHSLLEIELITGRKHQIRVQLASLGHPIAGDRKYDSSTSLGSSQLQIALHCYHLKFAHPTTKQPMIFQAKPQWNQWKIASTFRASIQSLTGENNDIEIDSKLLMEEQGRGADETN